MRKRILLLVSRKGKKYLAMTAVVVLAAILANTIIFANIERNPVEGRFIIIDPGHGGIDGGTNDGSTFLEKDVNLQISEKLSAVLVTGGASIELTRDGDYSLDDRNSSGSTRHARDLLARVEMLNSGNNDIFISIHTNHSTRSQAIGPYIYYSTKYPSNQILAECLQDRLNRHMKDVLQIDTQRKPVTGDYFILRHALIPGVIVETGFVSNPTDKRLLKDESYQLQLCEAIYKGIIDYFQAVNEARN